MITFLEDSLGNLQAAHQTKANILWEAYKDRLGQFEFASMLLDLDSLPRTHHDLSTLEEPFTHEEIDSVVASLPSDKSPRPDGFNTDFIKKC